LPYGYGTQRNNVLSPSTLSLERHRLLWLFLNEESDFYIHCKKKVLHFAPEQAQTIQKPKKSGLYYN
jgi:hypothetical protein